MLKSFEEYSIIVEKIEFKENFIKEVEKLKDEPIAKYLLNYIKTNNDNDFDYVDLADMFSTNRLVITSKNNKPQVIKISRFLRKILPINLFSADKIDSFVIRLLNSAIEEAYFEIWKGNKIRNAYDPNNFIAKSGELSASCMSGKCYLPFFDLYCDNENISLLVLLYENKVVARAIIWKATYISKFGTSNVTVLDKIYAINDIEEEKLIKYAIDHNMLYYDDAGNFFKDKNGKGYYGEFFVKLENVDFLHYPYVDNMMYLNKEQKTLSNRKSPGSYLLHTKNGKLPNCTTCQDEYRLICTKCEGTSMYNGESCPNCDGTAFVDCPDCVK